MIFSYYQGRRDGSTKDEPFAWQSREFLRKLTIGKPCVFRVDYTLEGSGAREFGTVFINDKQNVGLIVAAAGWARVRVGGTQQSPFYEDLLKAQNEAETKGLGIHTKEPSNIAKAVRPLFGGEEGAEGFDSGAYFARVGKGAVVDAVVEGVNSGSTLRVTLMPEKVPATIMVAGIQCPSLGKRVVNKEEEMAGSNAEQPTPEPFAREARHFAEICCLSKDVQLVVEGISQFGVIVASVHYPIPVSTAQTQSQESPATNQDLASTLMRAGLAKTAEWSLNMMTTGAFKLREAERTAKQKRVGMWHSYVPKQTGSTKLSDEFTGVVVEVVSGDTIMVKDQNGGTERRVQLSSVRAPRMATREKAAEPWATEAKEFLRQRLIGKEVSVKMEYNRKVPQIVPNSNEERILSFGTVTISEKSSGGEIKVNNVAELLLVRGLGQVTKHKADEERSSHFEDLVNAEEAGKKGKKGIWSNKEAPPASRSNDISVPGTANRAKQHLPFLQRAGKVTGVVEYVLGGSRLKISVPKEGVVIAFSPAGVRCAGRDEPLAGEAVAFTRLHCMQRDVEVVVEGIDKSGTFLGTLVVPTAKHARQRFDLGIALLEEGLARLQRPWEASPEAVAALEKAQRARKGIWEKEDPAEAGAGAGAGEGGDEGVASQVEDKLEQKGLVGWPLLKGNHKEPGFNTKKEITITDIADANSFYVQFLSQGRMDWITEQLANLGLEEQQASQQQGAFKVGDRCIARFSADGEWYRAVVEKVDASDPTARQYDVYFIDYGNRDRVGSSAIRTSNAELNAIPPQAHMACLAFVKAPDLDDDFGVEAAQRLSQLVGGGQKLLATVEGQQRQSMTAPAESGGGAASYGYGKAQQAQQAVVKLSLTVHLQNQGKEGANGEASSSSDALPSAMTVNRVLAEEGLVRAIAPKAGAEALSPDSKHTWEAIKEGEEAARRGHIGLWRYGDPGDDDDDDGGFPALGGGKKTAMGNGSNARRR